MEKQPIKEEGIFRPHEDEIDLRRYVEILFKWWREILFLALLLPVLATTALLLWQLFGPATYTARATVVIARTDRSTMVDDRQEIVMNYYSPEYTNALVGLAYSGSIAQAVIDELTEELNEDELNEDELKPATLLENIEATSRNVLPNISGNSDLIAITAQSDSEEKSALIANSWAIHYVDHVYDVYGQVPTQLLNSMQAELNNAEKEYQNLQDELNEFVGNSPMLMLERQITNTLTVADSLIALQNDATISRLTSQPSEQSNSSAVFITLEEQKVLEQIDDQLRSLQADLETQRSMHQVLSEKRDIAWNTWKELKSQIDQMSVAQLSSRGQVRLASPAVPPEERDEIIDLSAVPIMALVGLFLGIFIAFFGEFMGRRPFLAEYKTYPYLRIKRITDG